MTETTAKELRTGDRFQYMRHDGRRWSRLYVVKHARFDADNGRVNITLAPVNATDSTEDLELPAIERIRLYR